jgi:uroporphyrinogen-III synthase
VVFTSANAVETVKLFLNQGPGGLVPNWDIFCLSGKTKDSVHLYFDSTRIKATADNGKDLAQRIIESGVHEIIFFCANKRRDELPTILQETGIKVHEVVIYETIETPAVSSEIPDAILFFSPSAVSSFFSANQLKKNTVCFAIGQTTANSIADYTDNRIITSESPSQEMMLASVQYYFQHKECFE